MAGQFTYPEWDARRGVYLPDHVRVLVSPAPGEPGRLPFWKGDTLGRPAELGRALGGFVRELGAMAPEVAKQHIDRLRELLRKS